MYYRVLLCTTVCTLPSVCDSLFFTVYVPSRATLSLLRFVLHRYPTSSTPSRNKAAENLARAHERALRIGESKRRRERGGDEGGSGGHPGDNEEEEEEEEEEDAALVRNRGQVRLMSDDSVCVAHALVGLVVFVVFVAIRAGLRA